VLIIDNEDFSMLNRRTGSVVDANNLDILFSDLGTYTLYWYCFRRIMATGGIIEITVMATGSLFLGIDPQEEFIFFWGEGGGLVRIWSNEEVKQPYKSF
jgi:hypothetical protein